MNSEKHVETKTHEMEEHKKLGYKNLTTYPRSIRRKVQRLYITLGELLGIFYASLAKTQLSEKDVGDLFTKLNKRWMTKVKNFGLELKNSDGVEAKEWFAKEILTTWKRRKEKSEKEEKSQQ